MSDEKELGEGLLKRNGIEPETLTEDRRKELRKMIERDKVRARGAKLGAVVGCAAGWAAALGVVIQRGTLGVVDVVLLLFVGFGFFLATLAVLLWFVGIYFGQRRIQTSLADISAQLEKLDKNQQADAEEQALKV